VAQSGTAVALRAISERYPGSNPGVGVYDSRKCFAEERLGQVLKDAKNCSAKEIYHVLRKELESYSVVEDDLTLAVIKKK
jgi:hypothetical protein